MQCQMYGSPTCLMCNDRPPPRAYVYILIICATAFNVNFTGSDEVLSAKEGIAIERHRPSSSSSRL